MKDDEEFVRSDDGMKEVVLLGGPQGIPEKMRAPFDQMVDHIKIQHRNGYEHFMLDPETAGSDPMHFCWSMRTQIAE